MAIETKIWVQGVLTAAKVSLLLESLRTQSWKSIYIFVKQEFILQPNSAGFFLALPNSDLCLPVFRMWTLAPQNINIFTHLLTLQPTQINFRTVTPRPLPTKIPIKYGSWFLCRSLCLQTKIHNQSTVFKSSLDDNFSPTRGCISHLLCQFHLFLFVFNFSFFLSLLILSFEYVKY